MPDVITTRLRCEYLTEPLAVDAKPPRLSWILQSEQRGVQQTAYRILVAGSEKALAADEGDLWDSGRIESDATAQVAYAGRTLTSGQTVFWKVRVWTADGKESPWSKPAAWRMGMLTPADWKAQWISAPNDEPQDRSALPTPAPMVRKAFVLAKPVKRAIVSASALGLYELRINGQRVGDHILAPEWTNYHKRVQYQAYDVTDLLKAGDNAVGAMLGDGWYGGRLGISHINKDGPTRGHYGRRRQLLVQIDVEFADGSRESIVTDSTWRTWTDGPIRKVCLLDGEVYDARKELPGWDTSAFNDASWTPVAVQSAPKAEVVAQPNEPIRITEELKPVGITEPAPGVYVVDFGQNLAGWCRLKVSGPAGTTIRLRHAEVLEPDGNIYRDNLRMKPLGGVLGARQEDEFTLCGKGVETFEPRFTYHGFRYVEIVGLPGKPAADAIVARVFHSDPPMAGKFECSSPLLNQLMKNIVWTHRDNMHSVPTDCPQRDERMGWMGDMLVFAQPACFNMDMAAFFTKWVRDIRDDQTADGRYPDFAPHPFGPAERFSGVPAWGDCGVVVPWRMYVNYGDERMLAEHFESARHWVDWIHGHNPDLLWKNQRNNDYSDWLNGDTLKLEGFPKGEAQISNELFATAFFQHSTQLVAKMAEVIGRESDAAQYNKLAEDIRQAFIKAYVKDDGRIEGNTQSTYAIALHFDLVPPEKREAAARHMVERIAAYKNHISTGFHTTVMLMNELTRTGHTDAAYALINNRTIPSWGYTIDQGGTTIWERWDGYVEGRGYQDPGMNSFNHYAIGSVGEWMYRAIVGINPDEKHPGYEHVIIHPRPGGGLTWAKGSYESLRGTIACGWELGGDGLNLTVTVPANTTAAVYVPATAADAVTESGKPASEAAGVKFLRTEEGAALYEVGSGTYKFVSKGWKP